jgi:hypothetical protein
MNDHQTEQIMQLLRAEYDKLDSSGEIEIEPAMLASKALAALDPESNSPVLVRWAAVMQMRQFSRTLCRQTTSGGAEDLQQDQLFGGRLQRRYPTVRGGRELYVTRENLTLGERRAITHRLSSEGSSKIAHADAFERETSRLLAAGAFKEELGEIEQQPQLQRDEAAEPVA